MKTSSDEIKKPKNQNELIKYLSREIQLLNDQGNRMLDSIQREELSVGVMMGK